MYEGFSIFLGKNLSSSSMREAPKEGWDKKKENGCQRER